MEVTSRRLIGYVLLAFAGMGVLAIALDAAGRGVALAVAIAALALLAGSYAWVGLAFLRVYGEEDANRVRRLRLRVHVPIMFGAPLVVMAAHPWGPATVAVAAGAWVVCHVVFLHWTIVAGLILRRRARRSPQPR